MWSIAQHLLPPTICRLCEQYHKNHMAICKQCIDLILPISNPCQQCGISLSSNNYINCGKCIKKPPMFDNIIAPYYFKEPIRSLLHEFKYSDGLYLSSFFAHLILI